MIAFFLWLIILKKIILIEICGKLTNILVKHKSIICFLFTIFVLNITTKKIFL